MAQGKQEAAFGSDVASLLAKLEAQCAHRRVMAPDPRDGCAKLRSNAQPGYGQDGAGESQASAATPGAAPGATPGAAPGIGPGKGGGQGKGRR
jgi:hypothetical protein